MQNNRKSNSMKSTLNAVSGITLIALVVTIVVLLILASVSITVVFGDNGILQLAKEAGEKTNESVKNDISSIGEIEDILHETQTGITVEKVTDAKPGELEVDASNENLLTINSIEDLVFFAHDVTNGNTYEDKTVKLGLSLDFASTKSYVDANRTDYGEYGYNGKLKKLLNESGFIPIGIQERLEYEEISKKSFCGTFDGDGNNIYNLKLKRTVESEGRLLIGLFASNYGTIQNLGMENASIDIEINTKKFSALAILAGTNENTIKNCYSTGYINVTSTGYSCNIGGLVGSNGGTIEKCYNNANVTVIRNCNNSDFRVGGVLGANSQPNGIVKNVYNTGDIKYSGLTEEWSWGCFTAGICGLNEKAEIKIGYNVNTKIEINEKDYSNSKCKIAHITNDNLGICTWGYYLQNELYLNNELVIDILGTPEDEAYMKSKEFVDELNSKNDNNNVWKQDTNNINNGYPILSWQ